MKQLTLKENQRGVTLFVGLILLVLITLMVTAAFKLSNTNLRSVGNMQARSEAINAANIAIEQVIGTPFTVSPRAEEINVDINNDGNRDYVVNIATPVCIRASIDLASPGVISSVTLGTGMSAASSTSWNTLWELDATVVDAVTGARVSLRSGIHVLLDQTQKTAVCP